MHISYMSGSCVWIDELLMGFFAVSSMGSRWSWRNWKEAVLLTKTVILSLDVGFFHPEISSWSKVSKWAFVCEFIFFPMLLLGCKGEAWWSWGIWVLEDSAMLEILSTLPSPHSGWLQEKEAAVGYSGTASGEGLHIILQLLQISW